VRRLALGAAILAALVVTLAGASRLRVERIAEQPLLPTRFDHAFHREVNCITCHHNFVERGLGTKQCLPCHKDWSTTEATRIDIMFHAFCTDCHRRERAAGEKSGPVKACDGCHIERGARRLATGSAARP
jgi:predicted CXXCH cytochrome family protein